jgi:hypothetical protein
MDSSTSEKTDKNQSLDPVDIALHVTTSSGIIRPAPDDDSPDQTKLSPTIDKK